MFLVQQLTGKNIEQQQVAQATKSLGKHTSVDVQLNKKQLNAAINYYLTRQQKIKN
nr:YpmS family protein [Liquorilactobacillus vini]